jgi:hypothetical protein
METTRPRPAAAWAMALPTSSSTISTTASRYVKPRPPRRPLRPRLRRRQQGRPSPCPHPRRKWSRRITEAARRQPERFLVWRSAPSAVPGRSPVDSLVNYIHRTPRSTGDRLNSPISSSSTLPPAPALHPRACWSNRSPPHPPPPSAETLPGCGRGDRARADPRQHSPPLPL